MKALVFNDLQNVTIQDKSMPYLINKDDVIVKVVMASICTSDIHIKHGHIPLAEKGVILGHEFVGEIYAIGEDCKQLQIGDRVAASCVTFCGDCYFCKKKCFNNCQKGGWLLGCRIDGGLAQFVRVPYAQTSLTKISKSVSYKSALLVGGILATGYYGCQLTQITNNDTVAIIGAGPVGLCAAMCAKNIFKAKKVVLIDVIQERLDIAKLHNVCDEVILNTSFKNTLQKIKSLTENMLADCVIEAAGADTTFDLAIHLARPEAIVGVVAMYDKGQILDLPKYYGKNLTVKFGGVNSGYSQQLINYIEEKTINTDFLLTKTYNYSDMQLALEEFENTKEFKLKFAIEFL